MPDAISDIFGSVGYCDQTLESPSTDPSSQSKTPLIDIFLNPSSESVEKKENLISKTLELSEAYFNTVNMTSLYPELFKGRVQFEDSFKKKHYTF